MNNYGSTDRGFLLSLLNRISTGRITLFTFVLALSTLLSVNLLDFPLSVPSMERIAGHKYLDMQQFYTADEAYQFLDDFGTEGRKTQLLLLPTIDLFLPFIVGLFGILAATYLFRNSDGINFWGNRLTIIPLFGWLLDYLENFFIFLTVINYPTRLDGIALTAGILTMTKGIFYQLTVVLLIVGGVYKLRNQK